MIEKDKKVSGGAYEEDKKQQTMYRKAYLLCLRAG